MPDKASGQPAGEPTRSYHSSAELDAHSAQLMRHRADEYTLSVVGAKTSLLLYLTRTDVMILAMLLAEAPALAPAES